jgi:hypothetical protein
MNPPYLFPNNVYTGHGAPFTGEGLDELIFLSNFFSALRNSMGESYSKWCFVVHKFKWPEHRTRTEPIFPGDGRLTALFLLGDEEELVSKQFTDGYSAVFRPYATYKTLFGNIHPWHPGYLDTVAESAPTEFQQRTTNCFFSGCLNRNRLPLYLAIKEHTLFRSLHPSNTHLRELHLRLRKPFIKQSIFNEWIPGGNIAFSAKFKSGLPPDIFSKKLADTKIALCPPGFRSNETHRHFEALRLGCIVISSPLPSTRFYRGSPIITMNSWLDLRSVIASLIADPEECMRLHQSSLNWWNQACSETALANYCTEILINQSNKPK